MAKKSNNLDEQLGRAINASSLTRYRLALTTSIDESQLAKFYNGRCGLSLEAMERLANALGYEINLQKKRHKTPPKRGK